MTFGELMDYAGGRFTFSLMWASALFSGKVENPFTANDENKSPELSKTQRKEATRRRMYANVLG